MACGGSPARGAQALPLPAFSFRKIDERIARKLCRRNTVSLHTEQRAFLLCPFVQRCGEALVKEFRERLSPIVSHGFCLGAKIHDQCRQAWLQVIATARLELIPEI